MIKSEILNKKSICHGLIYSTSNPDILIPIKGIVEDVHFDQDIPYYSIKLLKFYDNINFLKENLYDRPFQLKIDAKPKKFIIPKTFKIVGELENWFIDVCTHRFIIESNFVVKTKLELIDLFNKIQEYLIIKNLRAVRDSSIRPLFDNPLKISSKIEFEQRIRRMYGDKFTEEQILEFISWI
jgi:hypothetical protein